MKTIKRKILTTTLALAAAILFIGTGSAVVHADEEAYVAGKAKSRTDTIAVPEMQCGMCEKRISGALEKIPGISKVSADADMKHVVVTYNPRKITRAAIEARIAATGYDTETVHTTNAAQKALPMCCRPGAEH